MSEKMKIQKLEKVGHVGSCQSSPASYASAISAWSTPSPERVAAHAMQKLEEARALDVQAHERNEPLMAINKAIHAQVTATMNAIGMPRSWSEPDRKSRARFPKRIEHSAGYVGDLLREVKTDDGFAYATAQYERLKASYTDYADRAKREGEEKRQDVAKQREAEEAKRRADMELAAILVRYDLDVMATWSDVVDALRAKDKYLDLALGGLHVRMDWSEGPGEASNALERFSIETTQDKDIANDWLECLRDFCDGRTFRDTRWNYDVLFDLVQDKQLLADCRLADERARND